MNSGFLRNKRSGFIIIIMIFWVISPIQAQTFFRGPESAVFDTLYNRYLISNVGNGAIVQINSQGDTSFFSTALTTALGMQIIGNNLYVVSGRRVVGFDLATANITMSLTISEANLLNDITADASGNLYTTDVNGHKIFKVSPNCQTYSIFVNRNLNSPNGILFDPPKNRLLVCSFIPNSPIQAVSLADSSVSTVVSTILSSLDGLTVDNAGNIYVSSWGTNEVFRYDKNFAFAPEVVSRGHAGPGDIFFNRKTNTLVVPNVTSNTVDFISIDPTRMRVVNVPDGQLTIQAGINVVEDGGAVLVAPGIYKENINFRGKNITVASHFVISGDSTFIRNTVIDGSSPVHADTASCVLIVSGETSQAMLEGFTLTGGKGTVWRDIHLNALYREGGGILIELSSPTIRDNYIVGNEAINIAGVVSAGGGGIRCGDGNPLISNNVIKQNKGRYGAGIVMNFCTGTIKNNIIVNNSGGEDYGGSGIWLYRVGPTVIENNTIVGNSSTGSGVAQSGRGGGILVWSTSITGRNNIIWNNSQNFGNAIFLDGATTTLNYNDIQGGWQGIGNIDMDPLFADTTYVLSPTSPCIDSGDPNSPLDPDGTRADMGALFFYHFDTPYVRLVNHLLDDKQGNNNGKADAGETVKLILILKNTSLNAKNVSAALTNEDADVQLINSTVAYGNISQNQVKTNQTNPFTFSVLISSVMHRSQFYVNITADDGYSQTDSLELFIGSPDILLIDDDNSASYETHYSTALELKEMYSDRWEIVKKGIPAIETLKQYRAVIWFTGNDRENTLTVNEQALLASYLDNGGRLLLSGQDIGYDLVKAGSESDSLFYSHYLHSRFESDSSKSKIAVGVTGDPVTNGLTVNLSGIFGGAGNQSAPDVIAPIPPAVTILKYIPGLTGAGLRYENSLTGTRLVYLAFGFEGIAGPKEDSASNLIVKILEWLTAASTSVHENEQESIMPIYHLSQNYPNPFNPTTTIKYSIPQDEFVTLKIYNLLGEEIQIMVQKQQPAGSYQTMFNGKNLPSGLYLYKLQAGHFVDMKKFILLR